MNNPWTRSLGGGEALIKIIIGVNAAMFLFSLLLDLHTTRFGLNPFSFLSPGGRSLLFLGATGTFALDPLFFRQITGLVPIDAGFRWWTLLSANYLHGSFLHLLFNMLAVRQLAVLILREYGTHRMMIIYTAGGIFGFFVSWLAGVRLTIGASAALCALIGAALYYGKSRGGAYGQLVYRQIGGWAVAIFVFGLLVPGINNWGHGAGLVAGALIAWLVGYHERTTENMHHKALSAVFALMTVAVLGWSVFSGLYYRLLV